MRTQFARERFGGKDEPVSKDNVKLMGEMIALQALRTVKKFNIFTGKIKREKTLPLNLHAIVK